MIYLCKDPEGDIVMEPSMTGGMDPKKSTDATNYVNEIMNLKQQIADLEKKLTEVSAIVA